MPDIMGADKMLCIPVKCVVYENEWITLNYRKHIFQLTIIVIFNSNAKLTCDAKRAPAVAVPYDLLSF